MTTIKEQKFLPITEEGRIWQVASVGKSPFNTFLRECCQQSAKVKLIEYDSNLADQADVIFVTENCEQDLLNALLARGKTIVLHQPWKMDSSSLAKLLPETRAPGRLLASGLRRASTDFQIAQSMLKSGRIGSLQTVQYCSCELGTPSNASGGDLLKEFSYQLFDQLLKLAQDSVSRVYAFYHPQSSRNPTGLTAVIHFASGSTARIELQICSRLGYRTGWTLEGREGSYRSGKLFTTSSDGEIIDEPVTAKALPNHWLMDQWLLAFERLPSEIPSLSEIIPVVQLLEFVAESAATGQVVSNPRIESRSHD